MRYNTHNIINLIIIKNNDGISYIVGEVIFKSNQMNWIDERMKYNKKSNEPMNISKLHEYDLPYGNFYVH